MSGLEKFQSSEAWRTNIKKFLFIERKPVLLQQTVTINETQRYSLDIDEELKNIFEQKRNQKTVKFNLDERKLNKQNITTEDAQQNPTISTSTKIEAEEEMNRPVFHSDDTRYANQECNADESFEFEALEKMCEKTISDPNSTLYKYLHGGDIQKTVKFDFDEQNITEGDDNNPTSSTSAKIEGEAKMDLPVYNCDDIRYTYQETNSVDVFEFEALEKMCDKSMSDTNSTLFKYIHGGDEHKDRNMIQWPMTSDVHERDPLLVKLNNCTLLDDVEEPSRMWENTICCDTVLQTSPVKMVGLLRPSTIIEEAPDDSSNSDASSQMSFQTATKSAASDASSSAYDTATSILRETSILPFIEKAKTDSLDSTPTSDVTTNENRSTLNVSIDLIDLENTFVPLHNSHQSLILEETIAYVDDLDADDKIKELSELEDKENEVHSYNILDESVIEILSDDEIVEEPEKKNEDQKEHRNGQDLMLFAEIKSEEISKDSISVNHDTYSFNASHEENKENCLNVEESSNKSMQFNDTMEEVEYMLKKGKEYMEAEAAAKQISEQVKLANSASKTQLNSPMIKTKTIAHVTASASKVKSSAYISPAKKTPSSKGVGSSSKNRCDFDIRPIPKLDIFAKPTPQHARHKELLSKQQKFSHIISPIGTYMKKTATTPLMASMMSKNKNSADLNSTAFRELENESRLYQPKFETNSSSTETSGLSKQPGQRTLPKKAYISSELKHIVDERTPVTIPGGKKIQKYLENAMMPAVLRHDGKYKITGGKNDKLNIASSSNAHSRLPLKTPNTADGGTTTSHIPRRNNGSLADLSLMSGDVSMYTIMDANKF